MSNEMLMRVRLGMTERGVADRIRAPQVYARAAREPSVVLLMAAVLPKTPGPQ